MRRVFLKFSLIFWWIGLLPLIAIGQNKVAISISNPSNMDVCLESEYLEIEVRNITTSTVTGIETEVELPTAVTYVSGSLNTSGASEQNISNLSKPVFSLPSIGIASAVTLRIKIVADCDVINFLNGGGLAVIKTTTTYSGGSTSKNSNPLSIRQPSLQISNITNRFVTTDLGSVVVRQITVRNVGSGRLGELTLRRITQSGVEFIGSNRNTTISTNGDTIRTKLDSNQFNGTYIGNSDNYLDYNEAVTTTDTIKVLSCSNLVVYYTASWGCFGSTCDQFNASTNVTISTRSPRLLFTPTSNTSACMSGSNQHDQEIVIYNAGDDSARAVELDVFQSVNTGYYIYQVSEILVSTFTYQKGRNAGTVTITPSKTNPTYNQGVYSCLSSNPRGRALLELPSMAPGDSLIVKWQTQSCCPQVCNSGFYAQRWKFASTYKDQCENTISSGEYWGSTGFYQRMDFSQSTPTDISDGQTRTFEYNVTNGTLMSPSSSSLFQIELILPDGISHSLNASEIQFTHPNGGSWTPDYVYQSNDTVIAGFQGAPSMNLTRSDLLIKLTGDCSNSSANSNLDYSMNIRYNPDTTCANSCFIPVYCITSTIRLHCQPSCAAGLHFNGFEAQRISYGLPDNNNDGIPDASGAIDLDKIKTDRLMYGDTLLTTFRSKVYSAGSINQWYNGEASTVMDYGRYLSVADVRIKIYRNGNLLFNCNNIDYNYSTAGYYRTFTFDIGYNNLVNSGCSLYSSFAYLSVDSIELEVKYVVDENPGNFTRDLNFTNDFYLETNTGQRYQCDSFYGRMKLIGSYFTNYGRGVYTGAGCGNLNVSQNFYLSIGNCCTNYAGGNMFPYEYRAWAKLDKILLHLPTGFDYVSSRMYMYRTAGTSVTDYDYFSSLSPDTIQNGIAIFDAGKLYEDQSGSVPISDDGFYGIFLPTLRANCEATQGNKNIRYDFVFEKLGNLGSGYDTLQSGANDDVVQYNRPILSIIPEQKEVYAQSDTVEWNIRVTNSSTSADAEYVWIGANNTSNVKLVEVINRSTGVAVPRTNDIFKLGLIAKSAIKDYTIRAVYQNCDPDSIEILLGYDCRFYPDSVSAYDCSREKAFLSYIPINTRLEADIVGTLDSVYLCEDKAYTVLIRNTGNPKVFNAYLDVLVRPGMVLNDTAWLFIKGSSDSTMILNPVAQNGNTYRWELASQDSTLANEGLQGASSGVGSEVYLRMKISTNCDFVSGSFFMLKPGGYLKCGKAVNAAFDIGDPIDIVGVTRPYYSAISFDINHLDVCNYVDETKVKFINLGPDTTGLTDQVIISFPRGLIADTTYISSKHNAPTDYPDFEVVNGENVFTWDIPSGITPGDSMVFDLKTIIQNEALDCGTKQIFTQAVVSQPVMCIKDSTYCNIKVATSSALTSDSVEKGIYQLDFVSATSVPNGSLEDVDLYYEIENSGSAKFTGSPLNVDFYYDANNNNIVDSGDTRIATDTVYEALLSGNVVTRNFNFSLASDRSCQVLIYISDSSCVCAPVTEKVDVIQLKNAGKDTLICPNVEIQIGEPGNSQNSYSWNNQEFVSNPDSSITGFTGVNLKNVKDTAIMVLTTNKGLCSSTDTVNVLLYPGMSLKLDDTTQLCRGDSKLIGEPVSGGVGVRKSYVWSPADSLSLPNNVRTYAYPDSSTTYYISISDASNCTIRDSIHVEVISKPEVDFTLQDTCAGLRFSFNNETVYTGSAKDSVSWEVGQIEQSNFDNFSLTIDSAQDITVKLYSRNTAGCWDTTSKLLSVYPNPVPEIMLYNDCAFDTSTLKATSIISSGLTTEFWRIKNDTFVGNSVIIQTGSEPEIPVELYSVSDKGCVTTAYDTLELFAKPEISIDDLSSCFGDSIAMTLSTSVNLDTIQFIEWTASNLSSSNDPIFKPVFNDTGNYAINVMVRNRALCADTAEAIVRVNPLPVSTFTVDDVCEGEEFKLYDSSFISLGSINEILWDTGSGFKSGIDSIFSRKSIQGGYSFRQKVISSEGCVDSSEQFAALHYVPELDFTVSGNCVYSNFDFALNGVPQDSISTIQWRVDAQTYTSENFTHIFSTPGIYNVYQEAVTIQNCFVIDSGTVEVDPKPVASFIVKQKCNDQTIEFVNTGNTAIWNLGDGSTSVLDSFEYRYDTAGNYAVELQVVNSFGCRDTTSENVQVFNDPIPDFNIKNVCRFDSQWVSNRSQTFAEPITSAVFNMDNGETVSNLDSFKYAYQNAGIYQVELTITTLPGCTYSTTRNVEIYALPNAAFVLSPENADIFNSEVTVIDESGNADSVVYFLSDGTSYSTRDFKHAFQDSGTFYINQYVSNVYGCLDSAQRELYITFLYKLFIPNSFSPNDDGINDVFQPKGMGMKSYTMQIYNRWGQMVFESDQPNEAWDGKDAMMGYYVYQIKAYDFQGEPHYYNGVVYLLR